MRARNIKPGLWKDEELANLPIEARYLFPGLWCLADCRGRLEDRPRLIKSEIFPFDDGIGAAKVHHLLGLLEDGGFILRYEVDRRKYIQVVNFERHQNPHKQERDKGSQIPDPPMVESHQKKTEVVPIKTEPDQNRAESLAMIPDSRFLIPDMRTADIRAAAESVMLAPTQPLQHRKAPEGPEFDIGTEPSVIDHHPLTKRAVVNLFPDAGEDLVRAMITKCVQEVISAGQPLEDLTDEAIAIGVGECFKPRKQYSAALFLETVPTWVRNKAEEVCEL